MKTFAEYQEETTRTMGDGDLTLWALGLCGEAGEFAEMIKKHVGHKHELDKLKAAKELGDVLWYISAASLSLGISLEEIVNINVEKLRTRYPKGFSTVDSINRIDEIPTQDSFNRGDANVKVSSR